MINIGQNVRVKNTDIVGVVEVIDIHHPKIAIRISIKNGVTPVTDYFLHDLEILI